MIIVRLFQGLIGAIALSLCGVAAWRLLRRERRAALFVSLAGLVSAAFFVSIRGTPIATILIALLTAATGFIIAAPRKDRSDLDDTTMRRRPKN